MRPLTMIYSRSAIPSALLGGGGQKKAPRRPGDSAGHQPGPPQAAVEVLSSIQRRRRRKREIGEPFGWARSSHLHPCLGWLHGEKGFSFTRILL